MDKGLHKNFKSVLNEILEALKILGKPGSEVSFLIIEPRNFVEVTRLSEDMRKSWLKATLKEIKNLFNYQNFPVDDP